MPTIEDPCQCHTDLLDARLGAAALVRPDVHIQRGGAEAASGIQLPSFTSSRTISAMPTLEAILRDNGNVTACRGCRPDNRSSTGSASVHHAASA